MFLYLFHIWMATILAVMPKQTKELCSQSNTSFMIGEKITYTIFYNVIGLYVNAGTAQFTVTPTKWEGDAAFAFTASTSAFTASASAFTAATIVFSVFALSVIF